MFPVVYSDYATSILSHLKQQGIDVSELVAASGLPSEYQQTESTFLPLRAVFRLLEVTYQELGDKKATTLIRDALHTHIVPKILSELDECKTVEQALNQVIRLIQIQIPQSKVLLAPMENGVIFSRQKTANTDDSAFIWSEVFTVWIMIELVQALTKSNWLPKQVHVQSHSCTELIPCFPRQIQFIQAREASGVVIDNKVLSQPVFISSPAPSDEDEGNAHYNAISQTYSALRPYVLELKFNLERAAQIIEVSKRTLQRRLNQHGITFRQLRDNLIADLALEQLQQGEAVSRVAVNMGFASITQFSRSFKRITGLAPSRIALRQF
ncbi:helix-turn-helix domain-containing protein [Vibrio sp. DNB22_10_4]